MIKQSKSNKHVLQPFQFVCLFVIREDRFWILESGFWSLDVWNWCAWPKTRGDKKGQREESELWKQQILTCHEISWPTLVTYHSRPQTPGNISAWRFKLVTTFLETPRWTPRQPHQTDQTWWSHPRSPSSCGHASVSKGFCCKKLCGACYLFLAAWHRSFTLLAFGVLPELSSQIFIAAEGWWRPMLLWDCRSPIAYSFSSGKMTISLQLSSNRPPVTFRASESCHPIHSGGKIEVVNGEFGICGSFDVFCFNLLWLLFLSFSFNLHWIILLKGEVESVPGQVASGEAKAGVAKTRKMCWLM